MDSIQEQLQSVQITKESGKKLGLVALADKKEKNTRGTPVLVETNIRQLTLTPNQPIYKYGVQTKFYYRKADGTEVMIEISKSDKKGTEHDNDKHRCVKVYKEAMKRYPELRKGGPYFYDRQAAMYSLSKLAKEEISFTVTEGVSNRVNFIRAEFVLKKVDESFQSTSNDIEKTVNKAPALADRTLIEALNVIVSGPAFENKNVITIGNCVHYLIDPSVDRLNVPYKEYTEGALYSGVGASKAVKTLEGPAVKNGKSKPSLYMTTEMKTTLFHPDYANLVELMSTYKNFSVDLRANSPAAIRISKAFIGLEVTLDYGPHKGLREDGVVMKIRGFSNSSNDTVFDHDGSKVTVTQYFKSKYGIVLKYPNLFTIEAKGKKGKIHLPAEVLLLSPSQTVTNDQMINNEQADMIKMSAAQPHIRKDVTDQVVKSVGLASNKIYDFIKVDPPTKVEGIVLNKPKILFTGGQADLQNPRAKFPTDFARAGKYFIAKSLTKWELCFVQGEDIKGLDEQLVNEMKTNGMKVERPTITYIQRGDLNTVFQNAKKAQRQMIFFCVKSRYNYHQEIKALEQQYDLLTQEIRAETAEKVFRQPQTRLNIVNKTNMKLGGLNYMIGSDSFKNNTRLIIGFETSQRGGGSADMPISVGFAANMLDHFQKFAGGYVYVKRERDIYGPIIKETVTKIIKTTKEKRGAPPSDILIYFNGVTEGQFALINEEFSKSVRDACTSCHSSFKPSITIIASSKTHNERLYKSDGGRISNLEPGTVVDHTIVSPMYTEWYHASAVARQGTTKTTKFTVVYTNIPKEPLWNLEQLTNDLCYDHQIVFHPVGLPVPLFIAGRYSQRGAMILNFNGPVYTNGELDLEKTNEALGYSNKGLFQTRFNA